MSKFKQTVIPFSFQMKMRLWGLILSQHLQTAGIAKLHFYNQDFEEVQFDAKKIKKL